MEEHAKLSLLPVGAAIPCNRRRRTAILTMFTRIYRNLILTSLSLCSLVGPLPRSVEAQVNVLTHHNDVARTGQNLAEKQLTTSNVNVARFGKLFERPVDSNLWCQPLYVSGLNMPGKGVRNVVFVQTEVGQF